MNDDLIDQIRQLSHEEKLYLLEILWADISEELQEKQYSEEVPEGLELRIRLSSNDDNRYFS